VEESTSIENSKPKEVEKVYDLEERTFSFAKDCRKLIRSLKSTLSNIEDGRQLIRSSGSV